MRFAPGYHSVMRNGWNIHAVEKLASQSSSTGPILCLPNYQGHRTRPFGFFKGANSLDFTFSRILLDLILIIIITKMLGLLLKPLKQPRIVSDILGGVFIGPSVLGHNKRFANNVLPDHAKYVVANLGNMGFWYFLFVSSAKVDFSLLRKLRKKHICTAVIGVFFPTVAVCIVASFFKSSLHGNLAKPVGYAGLAASLSITVFPVIYLVLQELNLLSSEVGRMALATALVSDVIGLIGILGFETAKQCQISRANGLLYVASSAVVVAFVVLVIRPLLFWIAETAPEGKPLPQSYVVSILLGALVMGFLSDMFGLAFANGALMLGIIMPDGPPLGATMVQRSETMVMEILMPFTFAVVGLNTDVFALANYGWSKLEPLVVMVLTGYLSKLAITLVVALMFGVPFKESLTLGLMMNLRGHFEIMIFLKWIDMRIFEIPTYTLLVISTTLMTGICTSLISIIYDPTRPYVTNKRRTIQHIPPGTELSIVVCIHDEECVGGLINLLDITHPTVTNPFAVYSVHLVELVGRAFPVLIDHNEPEKLRRYMKYKHIHSPLKLYQETRSDYVKLHSFTAVTAKQTMYQDICELALRHKATLIILPFQKNRVDNVAGTEIVRQACGVPSIHSKVLATSPCSVGILVDKGHFTNPIAMQYYSHHFIHRYIVLFLGGADSREALAYADRMAANPEVSLTVIRFLSYNNIGDDAMEKKLDDGMVTSFWVKNEGNTRVVYREVVVRNGEETLAAIQAMNDDTNELWIVGRKQGINQVLLQGLSKWSENPELGVIGDFVASFDFGSAASVLVVHQQIMRG